MFSYPYHPQSTGGIEGFNCVYKNKLKKIAALDLVNWDKYILLTTTAYNQSLSIPAIFYPFELHYKKQLNLVTGLTINNNFIKNSDELLENYRIKYKQN